MENNYKTPGQRLSALLEQKGWTKRVLAVVLNMNEPTVNKLAADKQRFTAEIAISLEEVLGEPADSFLELQKSFDLAMARIKAIPNPGQAVRAHLFSKLPISEMIKRGWLDAENIKDIKNIEIGLCSFFGVNQVEEIEILPYAAKKTEVALDTTPIQLAWLYRVKQIADEMIAPRCSAQSVKAAIEKLKPLRISAEATRKVPRILAESGIRFIVVESLPSAKIDGVCMWLDEFSPVIGMTLRFDRIDNFWFVLRHELEHILCEHGKTKICIDTELVEENTGTGGNIPEEERVANLAATEFIAPQKKIDAFIARKAPAFSERDLIGFSKTIGVHPGLIVGQLQYRTNRYNIFRKHLEKIRSHVCPSAVVDGWGNIAPIDY
uniref:HTH-type transcriptional regulator / antitoxin HigA n=1 Tax=Candidatus Kentrum sp. LPFa TaxID=2126335 RepID=A0A450WFD5_9GAMM|nr:MAG: HTH-type transcriptional regulator / antitoxin HigA [Candidatus Kentron sp. LPFa]